MSKKRRYAAYLFRWQENEDRTYWRATAEDAHTGEKHHFTDKNKLVHFLWRSLHDETMSGSAEAASEAASEAAPEQDLN